MSKNIQSFWADPNSVRDLNGMPVTPVLHHGRAGWHTESLDARVRIPAPQLNEPSGSLIMWILPREDFSTSLCSPWMAELEPLNSLYMLLSDRNDDEAKKNPNQHRFALIYTRDWYQQLQAKWHHGGVYGNDEVNDPGCGMFQVGKGKAYIGLSHLNLHRGHWMQIGLSWNEATNDYRMYINGILATTATTTLNYPLCREQNSGVLYAGHPLFTIGELSFYEKPLAAIDFSKSYASAALHENAEIDAKLNQVFTGSNSKKLEWKPSSAWLERVNLPLNRKEDLTHFYVQGMTEAPSITTEGLRIRTSALHNSQLEKKTKSDSEANPNGLKETWDPTQVYLWLEDYFTGDFAVEYEFKSLQNHGLSLLMTRAAGLHGEDFLKNKPRRVSGSMRAVCWENIRNYHWEYYRQMEDARNDTASHVLVKNPFLHPIAYQDSPKILSLEKWHRIQFVHEGNRLRGAIDGIQIFDLIDDPFAGFGPVLRTGTIAIRCMWDTDMVFRNLKVWSSPDTF